MNKKTILILICILVVVLVALLVVFFVQQNTDQIDGDGERTYQFFDDGAFITSDGFHFVSEDFYFGMPNFDNLVYDGSGRKFFNNELQIRAELNIAKYTFQELALDLNAEITAFRRSERFGDRYTFTFENAFKLEELEYLVKILSELEFVYSAEIVRPMNIEPTIMTTPTDPRWEQNWGFAAVNAPSAWAHRESLENVNVLIIDTGFYRNHEDLEFRINLDENLGLNTNPRHGTHVAGIIGATWNNRGVSGIAPNSAMFAIPVVGLDIERIMDIMETHIRVHNVRVINASISFVGHQIEFAYSMEDDFARVSMDRTTRVIEEHLLDMIENQHQFVLITSAGNQGEFDVNRAFENVRFVEDGNERYGFRQHRNGNLAGIEGTTCVLSRIQNEDVRNRIIIVGAAESNSNVAMSAEMGVTGEFSPFRVANFSQHCDRVDVIAPGVEIYSTLRGRNTYGNLCGTSMAAPFVSGLATMIFGANPNLTGAEVREIIINTADSQNHNMINAGEAVRVAIERLNQPSTNDHDTPSELPFVGGVDSYEVTGAYMDFLHQRGFEQYIPHWIEDEIIRYAIVDINNDRLPKLIVSTIGFHGWYDDLLFSYDTNTQSVVFVRALSRWSYLLYSIEDNVLVSWSGARTPPDYFRIVGQEVTFGEFTGATDELDEVIFTNIPQGERVSTQISGFNWVVEPTLGYRRISRCDCGIFSTDNSDPINERTGEIIYLEAHGHGAWGSKLVYDTSINLFGVFHFDMMYESLHFFSSTSEILANFPTLSNSIKLVYEINSADIGVTEWGTYDLSGAYTGRVAIAFGANLVTDFIFDGGEQRSLYMPDNNIVAVQQGDRWGIVDRNGNMITPFVFGHAVTIDNYTAFAMYNGRYGILDLR